MPGSSPAARYSSTASCCSISAASRSPRQRYITPRALRALPRNAGLPPGSSSAPHNHVTPSLHRDRMSQNSCSPAARRRPVSTSSAVVPAASRRSTARRFGSSRSTRASHARWSGPVIPTSARATSSTAHFAARSRTSATDADCSSSSRANCRVVSNMSTRRRSSESDRSIVTRCASVNACSSSKYVAAEMAGPPHTAITASLDALAGNPPSAANASFADGVSRRTLHSSAARMLRCCAEASLRPTLSRSKTSSRWRSMSAGETIRDRAAASSIASGRPSSRRHSSATASTSPVPGPATHPAATARSTNRRTAGPAAGSVPVAASVGTTKHASPAMRSGTRLVATTRKPGQDRSRVATSPAAVVSCSMLSNTSTSWRAARCSTSDSRSVRVGPCSTPSAAPIVAASSAGSWRDANGTNATGASTREAISMASRDLPTPPGPINVTIR